MIAFRGQCHPIQTPATETTIDVDLSPNASDNPGVAPQPGDLCILFMSSGGGTVYQDVTLPAGWVTLRPFLNAKTGTTTATHAFGCWAKILTAEDIAAHLQYRQTAGTLAFLWAVWFSNVPSNADLQIGTYVGRTDPGSWASTTTAVAPSITLPRRGTVLAIAAERTMTAETPSQVTASGSIALPQVYYKNADGQSVALFGADHPAGQTGAVTIKYPNPHPNNAGALLLGILNPEVADFNVKFGNQTGTMRVGTSTGLKQVLGAMAIRPR